MFHLVQKIRKAKALRAEAERKLKVAELKAAIMRGDTRAIGAAFPAARDATLAALRAEVKR